MYTGKHVFAHNYVNGVDLTWGVRWTCIHVLMPVHIPTKVWEQITDAWNMHVGLHRDAHLCTQLCKRDGADMGKSDGYAYMY